MAGIYYIYIVGSNYCILQKAAMMKGSVKIVLFSSLKNFNQSHIFNLH